MTSFTTPLPDDTESLKEIIYKLQNEVDFFKEQFRLNQHKLFSPSSEASSGQGSLFDEAEVDTTADELPEETGKEEISYARNKPKRKALPKDLPREIIVHDIPEEDKVCRCCNGALHEMGSDKSEQLEFKPACIKVIENVRLKYSCRACEKTDIRVNVLIAPVPVSPIPKSIATPSLLSQIIIQKYQYALPLYRQESVFKQYGVDLNRKTMSSWMIRCAELLEPLIKRLKLELLKQPYIHADETTLKVIKDDKQKSYMWVYCTGTDSPSGNKIKNIVLYEYQNTRSGQCATDYLGDYDQHLIVDGYAGYSNVKATLVGCMAHARRKFVEAQRGQVKGKIGKADWAINHIKKLYRVEQKIKGKTQEEQYQIRQEKSKQLLDAFKAWLDKSEQQVPPKSLIGAAIRYSLNQWDKLSRYIETADLPIDNNRAERAIKPFVIGRKNWMFSNTARGAQASANLYSLIETAKANGIMPFDYMEHLLTELPKRKCGVNIDDLLPWEFKC